MLPLSTTCPNCGKIYVPVLGERKRPEVTIQTEFPDATPVQREQYVSGICSDKCWREFLGQVALSDEINAELDAEEKCAAEASCQKCGEVRGDLCDCKTCKLRVCGRCMDRVRVHQCQECASLSRAADHSSGRYLP